jgi:hypothetical protein
VCGQRHAPAALPPEKTRYPLYRRLGEPQDRSGQARKIWPPLGFDPRTAQPVASRYIDWAIPDHYRGHVVRRVNCSFGTRKIQLQVIILCLRTCASWSFEHNITSSNDIVSTAYFIQRQIGCIIMNSKLRPSRTGGGRHRVLALQRTLRLGLVLAVEIEYFLIFDYRLWWVLSFTSWPPFPQKTAPRIHCKKCTKPGCTKESCSAHCPKNILRPKKGIARRLSGHASHSLITMPTELHNCSVSVYYSEVSKNCHSRQPVLQLRSEGDIKMYKINLMWFWPCIVDNMWK